MSQATIRAEFPRLNRSTFFVTSNEDPFYNCIAYAAADTTRWWWPVTHGHPGQASTAYWPPDVDKKEDIPSFVAAFATLGYQPCENGTLEHGFEKVALFADAKGVPKHAARQLPSGKWTSKLGTHEDISHLLYGLEGGGYGDVVTYLKRKKATT